MYTNSGEQTRDLNAQSVVCHFQAKMRLPTIKACTVIAKGCSIVKSVAGPSNRPFRKADIHIPNERDGPGVALRLGRSRGNSHPTPRAGSWRKPVGGHAVRFLRFSPKKDTAPMIWARALKDHVQLSMRTLLSMDVSQTC